MNKKVFAGILAFCLMAPLSACITDVEPAPVDTASGSEETKLPYEDVDPYKVDAFVRYYANLEGQADGDDSADDFYAKDANALTDEELAENLDNLDVVPSQTESDELNRYADYMTSENASKDEAGEHSMYLYTEDYSQNPEGEYKAFEVEVPSFGDDEPEYSTSEDGSKQSISNSNANSDEYADVQTTSFLISDGQYANAKAYYDVLAAANENMGGKHYADFNEDKKCGAVAYIVKNEDGTVTGKLQIITTESVGTGANGSDIILETDFNVNGKPSLAKEDILSFVAYFTKLGLRIPTSFSL